MRKVRTNQIKYNRFRTPGLRATVLPSQLGRVWTMSTPAILIPETLRERVPELLRGTGADVSIRPASEEDVGRGFLATIVCDRDREVVKVECIVDQRWPGKIVLALKSAPSNRRGVDPGNWLLTRIEIVLRDNGATDW